jgi:hypothetical protein
MENNKQIKLAKKNQGKLHAEIHDVCIQIQQKKNPTSPDQAHGYGTSSRVNGPPVNHLKKFRDLEMQSES